MPETEAATIVAMGAGALLALWVGPGVLRRLGRRIRRRFAQARGRLQPFGGAAYVIDGDTLVIERVRVRLFGMDAPELTQAGGHAARAHLIGLVGRARLEVEPLDVDRFGRTVARVRRDGLDLSRAMVRDGFARAMLYWSWAYVGQEIGARRRGRGLWAASAVRGIEDPARHRRSVARRAPR